MDVCICVWTGHAYTPLSPRLPTFPKLLQSTGQVVIVGELGRREWKGASHLNAQRAMVVCFHVFFSRYSQACVLPSVSLWNYASGSKCMLLVLVRACATDDPSCLHFQRIEGNKKPNAPNRPPLPLPWHPAPHSILHKGQTRSIVYNKWADSSCTLLFWRRFVFLLTLGTEHIHFSTSWYQAYYSVSRLVTHASSWYYHFVNNGVT